MSHTFHAQIHVSDKRAKFRAPLAAIKNRGNVEIEPRYTQESMHKVWCWPDPLVAVDVALTILVPAVEGTGGLVMPRDVFFSETTKNVFVQA